jgi:hypothetical protein
MTHDEIVDKIVALLSSHDKYGGYFHREPYKSDFFRLFVLANERGTGLKAGRLHDLIAARAPEVFEGKNWPLLYAAWPEWEYAWSRFKLGASLDDDLPGG